MAHLRAVRLRGFKTFARPTELVFQPGVSVIIGPNGSGKSNIADAVLWALGEQSPTALRGRSMQDVIFSGSEGQRPSAFAEVALVFENSAGSLPLDYTEVEVTRRLLRDGSSEYRINGSVCRLLDIHELISGIGLGREMHTVISQGKVEQLLNSTPLSRKALVEEAAGLGRYKKRRQRTQAKLERVQQNLDRVADVEREVRLALRPLKQQMEAAERHLVLVEQLALVRAKLLLLELREIDAGMSVAGTQLTEVESRKTAVEEGLDRLRQERGREEERFAGALRRREELAGQYHGSRAELDGLTSRGDALRQRYARLEAEATRATRRRESAELELESANARLASLEGLPLPGTGRLSWVTGAADRLADRLAEVAPALAAFEREEEDLKDRVFELEASRSRALQEAEFLRRELEDRGRQAEELVKREQAGADHLAGVEREESAALITAAEAEARRTSLAADVTSLTEDLTRRRTEAERARVAAREGNEVLASLASRERVLRGLVAGREGVPPAARDLLDREPAARLVAETLRVTPGYERAVAAALGPLSQAVLLPGRRDPAVVGGAHGPVEVVWLGEAAGAVATTVPVPGLQDVWEVATGEPEIVRALAALLPPTYVLDDLTSPVAAQVGHGSRVVDREGRLLTGQAHAARRGEAGAEGLFAARSELELLEGGRRDAAAAADRAAGEADQAQARLDLGQTALLEAEGVLRETERELGSLRDETGLLSRRKSQAAADLQAASERRRAAAELSTRLARDLAGLETRVDEDETGLEAARAALRGLRERTETVRREVGRLEEKRSQAAVLAVRIRERQRAVEEERARSEEQRLRADASLTRSRLHEERLRQVLTPLADLATVVARLAATARDLVAELEARVEASRATSEGFADTLKDLGQREADLQHELVGLGEGLVQVQVRLAHLQDQAGERRRALADLCRRHQSPRELGPGDAGDETEGALAGAIEQLERRQERLGPVNPLAEQEYRETAERAQFLDEQRRDLEASLAELRQVIGDLDRHIETTFTQVFEATRVHFEAMVEMLFPGGRGVLKLVDVAPADVAAGEEADAEEGADEEAGVAGGGEGGGTMLQGVALEVKPPRKAPRSLTLLSGGEKALAAIAFLFALFLARPCPFYILDEVEAALDDVNIGRFLSLVRRYQDQTQFIIITHQRRTMEIADSLYGVAMDPDGTSRVLSRRLAQDVAPS